ncbi:phage baseplate plug family protein [Xenorhabdus griffiniae]|uniref:Cyanophage baseplate Pam3 plug gp18 domain-containing protein n=1 Tax=Xenorhabdus griffiniae TaxID=351672 RepID=A0ABY9XKL0_9GAMM|nr:hypothetical protein [Xenorhabdus griffiniae]MBD1228575.1 hypothetical protein [Xenorhabdus griffiniae]MBE8588688.1 hypothetical protein [Xenorhabdus griffiniae]WMV73466.1 hypothetical protein QL128_05420 [Xenorhabdus griffiniae]WNH03145.1 hypothetical protein QL112_005425 [Xenorhabdus griffiniae]
MSVVEIPLLNENQLFDIQLGGIEYRMKIQYREIAGWILDIMHPNSEPIVLGVPLVTGIDILERYRYLGFNGALVFVCNGVDEKSEEAVGGTGRLYFKSF